MRKGAAKGKNLSQVDTYRRRIGEKEVRKVRAHLHGLDTNLASPTRSTFS
jgi:hypothetical protein